MGAGESPMMDSAYSLTPEEIAAAVEACGEKPWRAAQVCQWLYGGRAERWDAMANVPAALRQALSARLRDLDGTARVQEVAAEGGATTKLLLGLHDGEMIETVIIPARESYLDAAKVLEKAQAREANEEDKRKRLASGELGLDMYGFRQKLTDMGLKWI